MTFVVLSSVAVPAASDGTERVPIIVSSGVNTASLERTNPTVNEPAAVVPLFSTAFGIAKVRSTGPEGGS